MSELLKTFENNTNVRITSELIYTLMTNGMIRYHVKQFSDDLWIQKFVFMIYKIEEVAKFIKY